MLELIPQPRHMQLKDVSVPVSAVQLAEIPQALTGYQTAITELLDSIQGPAEHPALGMTFSPLPARPQAYELEIGEEGIAVRAPDSLGALYAVRTLVDIWHQTQPELPSLVISDHPTYPNRGVFIESFWGSDHMSREDWFELIDQLAGLKLNSLAISLYGCWDLRHFADNGEFINVPLDRYPQLRSPHRMRTWDPETGEEVRYEYLPRMFKENLFGDVARYAQKRGMHVIPLFGGPGHSSLLPRLIPELSALDDAGEPTGYGYCLTRPEPRARLLDLFDNLIEQHLLPNNIETLWIPGDEFYPIINIDPQDPLKEFSPYCRCATCRDLTPGQLLIEYFSLVGTHLTRNGIRMMNWQDTLTREDALDAYATRVAADEIPLPIVAWWKYNDPIPAIPKTPFEKWVCPSPGVIGSLFYQDMSGNIESWLREGARSGATGVTSYNMPDPCFHKNYACLADLSWNLEGSGGANGFKRRWARYVDPHHPDDTLHAYTTGENVLAAYPLMMYLINHLLPYFSTAPWGLTRFPDDLIRPLSVPSPAFISALAQTRESLRESARLLPETRTIPGWGNPTAVWQAEIERIAGHIDIFLGLLRLARQLHTTSLEELDPQITALEEQGQELLRHAAQSKAGYQLPSVLREHWVLVSNIRPALQRLLDDPGRMPSPHQSWHAWLF